MLMTDTTHLHPSKDVTIHYQQETATVVCNCK